MGKPFVSLIVTAALSAMAIAPANAAKITLVPMSGATVAAARYFATCAVPNAPATLAGTPFMQIPAIAESQGATGTAGVEVSLLPTGALASARLVLSTGNEHLDRAALQSAQLSQYRPELFGCSPVAGTYLYSVEF